MKLAITTPTGKVGRKLIDELLARGGHELHLLCRDKDKVREPVQRGAKAFAGKLEDRAFFTRATKGADALFLVLPMNSRSPGIFDECHEIVDSACHAIRTNAIPRVIFVSSMGAQMDRGTGPIAHLHQAETKLEAVAPNLTVLRPVFYMEQFMGWMKDIAENHALYMPLPASTPVPMIATRDVATYAADLLTDNRWSGHRVVPLHGPRAYTYSEAARILGQTLGLSLRTVEVEPKEYADRLQQRGWARPAVEHHLEMYEALAKGSLEDELPRAEWVMQPTTFETFVKAEFQPAFERLAALTA